MTLGVGVFVSVEMGMIAGTLTHLAILLYTSNTPKIVVQKIKVTLHYFNWVKYQEYQDYNFWILFDFQEVATVLNFLK